MAGDVKLSALNGGAPATAMATGDLMPFTSNPGGTPVSKNITRENFVLDIQALLPLLPIAAAGGTADAITADYTPNITLSSMRLCAFVATAANATTTPTFAPDGLTAHTIVKNGGSALAVGDIPAALAVCILQYDLANTRWELLNPAVGGGAVPVKASGAELDTGTDDDKFATAKALKDSHNVPSVAPGDAYNVLRSNGTDWTSVAGVAKTMTAQGDIVYASAANTLARLAKGAANTKLFMNATVPEWAAGISAVVSGTFDASLSTTFSITGAGFTPAAAIVYISIGTTSACSFGQVSGAAGAAGCIFNDAPTSGTNCWSVYGSVGFLRVAADKTNIIGFSAWTSDGITLTRSLSGSPTGTATYYVIFLR